MPPRRSRNTKATGDPEPSRLRVSKAYLDEQLDNQVKAGGKLLIKPVPTPEALHGLRDGYYSWDEFNRTLIKRAFTTEEEYSDYAGISFGHIADDPNEQYRDLLDDIKSAMRRLTSLRDRLQLYDDPATTEDPRSGTQTSHPSAEPAIFLVHGRDEGAKHGVTRFVESITGLEPIILAEQANLGQTVIEKFEKHASQVSYAIVLLTGDDEGRLKGTRSMKARARQNVILELGWFAGKLGRQKVAMLYETGVELPSDIVGILYAELDPGEGWKIKLAREMKAAGLPVDMNKVV